MFCIPLQKLNIAQATANTNWMCKKYSIWAILHERCLIKSRFLKRCFRLNHHSIVHVLVNLLFLFFSPIGEQVTGLWCEGDKAERRSQHGTPLLKWKLIPCRWRLRRLHNSSKEHLEEKYANHESKVAWLQKELSHAAEEKLQFEERLSRAGEEDSMKVKELEFQVKEMEEC